MRGRRGREGARSLERSRPATASGVGSAFFCSAPLARARRLRSHGVTASTAGRACQRTSGAVASRMTPQQLRHQRAAPRVEQDEVGRQGRRIRCAPSPPRHDGTTALPSSSSLRDALDQGISTPPERAGRGDGAAEAAAGAASPDIQAPLHAAGRDGGSAPLPTLRPAAHSSSGSLGAIPLAPSSQQAARAPSTSETGGITLPPGLSSLSPPLSLASSARASSATKRAVPAAAITPEEAQTLQAVCKASGLWPGVSDALPHGALRAMATHASWHSSPLQWRHTLLMVM